MSNFNYIYQLPPKNFLLSIKKSLSHFTDLFSEFSRYIAPAYYHDRCERSAHMRLYSMHKREFVSVYLGFFISFVLGILIGVTGPPITNTSAMIARKDILTNTSLAQNKNILATGPFAMKSPFLSTYSQQLWLIAQLTTNNNDDEIYDKSFHITVTIDGITEEHKPIRLATNHHNRTRHVSCVRNNCKEFTVMHLGFLDYAHYIITTRFYGLETFHHKYNITNLTFYFKMYSPDFTQIEIWFRFIFMLLTFVVFCWYLHSLRKFSIYDWSIEQKWVSILLPLLFFYNNPCFPLIFLLNSWLPGMLNGIMQATFLCALLMFWLCIYHGLRQNERTLINFYLPKIFSVLPIWLCAIVLTTWQRYNELIDPTYSHFVDAKHYYRFKSIFFISGFIYVLYLLLLIIKAYAELKSMPFFDIRLKFLTMLMLFVILVSISVTINRFGFGLLEDNFVASLNTTYGSSVQFMCFYGLLNFYLYTMAYVYSPSDRFNLAEISITKDNPAFSMINDSDEDILYRSDEELRRPLNGKNDYDSD